MIEKSDFLTVKNIWEKYLWPDRTSDIESHSAMLISRDHDMKNYEYPATFFVYKEDGIIMGCNSGHMCCDNTYRSRGLYVFPEYRKKGIGKMLLEATIQQGFTEDANMIWSYPRKESWSTYKSAGFELLSYWNMTETGSNAYCAYAE